MNRLKELRTRYGLSLRKLQEYTGIDFSRLAVIEKTNANLESKTVEKLTDFFKVSSTYFFGKDGFIFYYDEHNKRYFPLVYEQYRQLLNDDVVSYSIDNGCIKRTISLEGFDRINDYDNCLKKDLNVRIITEQYIEFLENLDSNDFERQRERIIEYFETKEARRYLSKKDED